MRKAAAILAALACLAPSSALAWGATGHRMVGELGTEALPDRLPAFLRERAADIGELAREPDRLKDSGKARDANWDPAHFIDLDDEGRVLGGPTLDTLPATRAEYETMLRAAGADSWQAGYLYYSLVEGWQQLVTDFAYIRALTAAERLADDPDKRAWFAADLARRRELTLRDLGAFAHYVGDASQPLHVTVHFNGWGPYPNPAGYTTAPVHAPLEGAFVRANVREAYVRRRMPAPWDCACSAEARTRAYLAETHETVDRLYELEKAGAFADGDPRGRDFDEMILAAAAAELRDYVVMAWDASANASIGWPQTKVADIEAGNADAYGPLYGLD